MIRYQTIKGVTLDNTTGLPSIHRTPEGIAMGAIPGWSLLVDPEYTGSGSVRNRAAPNAQIGLGLGEIQLGEFDSGAPSFDLQNAMQLGPGLTGARVNPDAWTFFVVMENLIPGPTNRHYVLKTRQEESGVITPTMALVRLAGVDQIVIYEDSIEEIGRPHRLEVRYEMEDTGPHLIMFTASVSHGVSIWVDGVREGYNADDRRPLNFGYGADDLTMFRGTRGTYGMSGILNIDLNAPENTGHRRAIEKFLMAKYSIPEGQQ